MVKIPRKSSRKKFEDQQLAMQEQAFGKIDPKRIWYRRKAKGFTTLPRTMPLLGAIMDGLSGKGKPVSTTYLELWCRSNDFGFVTLSKPAETAFASGFSGLRGVSTWRERLRKLNVLGFIDIKAGVSGPIHYVQIWNPYHIVKQHRADKTLGFLEDRYLTLFDRVMEIGAEDLED